MFTRKIIKSLSLISGIFLLSNVSYAKMATYGTLPVYFNNQTPHKILVTVKKQGQHNCAQVMLFLDRFTLSKNSNKTINIKYLRCLSPFLFSIKFTIFPSGNGVYRGFSSKNFTFTCATDMSGCAASPMPLSIPVSKGNSICVKSSSSSSELFSYTFTTKGC